MFPIIDIVLLILIFISSVATFITWHFNYWTNRNIPSELPRFPFGNMQDVILSGKSFPEYILELYKKYSSHRYVGLHLPRRPTLFVRDPELVKLILVQNFNHFRDTSGYVSENAEPLFSKNPFVLKGDLWKSVRSQLSPALTRGKVKQRFPGMETVAKRMIKYIEKNIDTFKSGTPVKELCMKYTSENFAWFGFGVDAKTFDDNPDPELARMVKQTFESNSWSVFFGFVLLLLDPLLMRLGRLRILDKSVTDSVTEYTREVLKYREKNNITCNDYFNHLMQLRDNCKEYDFNEEHIAAHMLTFLLDSVNTSSFVLTLVLYELARNEDAFRKLRDEIDTIAQTYNGEITYEALQEVKYLECCISETLRINTFFMFLSRQCTEPITFPPAVKGGSPLFVKKGTSLIIPVYALHNDSQYHPEPKKFRPERFNDENKDSLTPYTHFLFGAGPRQCLGMRYAIIQLKAAVANIVKNFDLKVNKKMKEPLLPVGPGIFSFLNQEVIVDFYKRGELYK